MATLIWTRYNGIGYHRWPGASGRRAYLASRHRHEFVIRVTARVAHNDRDTEFHDLQSHVRVWWGGAERECGDDSCETMAVALTGWLADRGVDVAEVEVSEDGQSGAIYRMEGTST